MGKTAEAVAWSVPVALVVGTTLGAILVMLSGPAPVNPDTSAHSSLAQWQAATSPYPSALSEASWLQPCSSEPQQDAACLDGSLLGLQREPRWAGWGQSAGPFLAAPPWE